MSSRFLPGIAAAATALFASCYPYPEDPYYRPGPPPNPYGPPLVSPGPGPQPRVVVGPQERERQRLRDLENQREQSPRTTERTDRTGPRNDPPPTRDTTPPKPPETVKPTYPVAMKVVGREGFVISPYNKKPIDVTGFAPGDLVRDPTYPLEEKKYFRVP